MIFVYCLKVPFELVVLRLSADSTFPHSRDFGLSLFLSMTLVIHTERNFHLYLLSVL